MPGQPWHNTQPHARLQPSFQSIGAWITSNLNEALVCKLRVSLMSLADIFDIPYMVVCTTRHWQTSGRLVQELNACTVVFLNSFRPAAAKTNQIFWWYLSTKSNIWTYLTERFSLKLYLQLFFKWFVNYCFILNYFQKYNRSTCLGQLTLGAYISRHVLINQICLNCFDWS